MSLYFKSFLCSRTCHVLKFLGTTQTRQAHWLPYYKPGPYPKTEEERIAAAKKYNLLPEEYEPYPEGEEGYGDYPKLPFESVDAKDPWYYWDNPELRKDFNEPVHVRMIHLVPELLTTAPKVKGDLEGCYIFLRTFAIVLLILYGLTKLKFCPPVFEKQYPFTGDKHFTFELDIEQEARRKKSKVICEEEE